MKSLLSVLLLVFSLSAVAEDHNLRYQLELHIPRVRDASRCAVSVKIEKSNGSTCFYQIIAAGFDNDCDFYDDVEGVFIQSQPMYAHGYKIISHETALKLLGFADLPEVCQLR